MPSYPELYHTQGVAAIAAEQLDIPAVIWDIKGYNSIIELKRGPLGPRGHAGGWRPVFVPESQLYDAILNGDAKLAICLTKKALDEGCNPLEVVGGSMIPAMDEVGRRFACQEYYVPDLLLSGRAMKGALQLVRPLLA